MNEPHPDVPLVESACPRALAFALALLLAVPAGAQDDSRSFALGDDHFQAGATVRFDAPEVDDVFLAGNVVRGVADVSGSAHLAGRDVAMTGTVGGDAYLAGMDVALDGAVAGDATLAGFRVRSGAVGGDLRASGGSVVVGGPVAGYALLSGETVRVEGTIGGDVYLTGETLEFGEDAYVTGRLVIFEEPMRLHPIPPSVVPEERLERRDLAEWEAATADLESESRSVVLVEFLVEVLKFAFLAVLLAAVRPGLLADLRRYVLARPGHALVTGFVAESAAIGSVVLFGMTVVGLVLVPVALLVAFVLGYAGYVVGVYALGVGLLSLVGRAAPAGLGARALAALVGAFVARSLAFVPYLGWFLFLALMLAGVGALASRSPWGVRAAQAGALPVPA